MTFRLLNGLTCKMGYSNCHAQIVVGLVAASVLIFLINAEDSQLETHQKDPHMKENSEVTRTENPLNSGHNASLFFKKLFGAQLSNQPETSLRNKRSPAYTFNQNQNSLHFPDSSSGQYSDEPRDGKAYPPVPASSSGSEFHKIRHAMKRLGGGGLDGDVVLRMILDSKPIPPETPVVTHHRPLEYLHESHLNSRRRLESAEQQPLYQRKESAAFSNEQLGRHFEFQQTIPAIIEKVIPTTASTVMEVQETPTVKMVDFEISVSASALEVDRLSRNLTTPRPELSIIPKNNNASATIIRENVEICYKTDDVLLVILVTCCLNFAFVFLIWTSVKYLSSSKQTDFLHLECSKGSTGDPDIFLQQTDGEMFWINRCISEHRHLINPRICTTSTSLYALRPDQMPRKILRRSRSYSMDELPYPRT